MITWAIGTQLGPYVLISPLGKGGMGEVWKARDTRLDRVVAIKRLKSEYSNRFKREARAIAALNHPNICQLYDVGPDYLESGSLRQSPTTNRTRSRLRRRAQGEEDADVLKSMDVLASIYASQRRFADSESLLAKAAEIQKRKFGPDDSDALKYTFELAAVYLLDEKLDRAEPLARDVVERRPRKLGPGDKVTLNAMLVLASIYDKQQKILQGLTIATTAYETSRRALRENDPITLGAKFMRQGFTVKSTTKPIDKGTRAEILENAAKSVENRTATSLPEMINLAANRATIFVNQGKPEEAVAPLLEALEAARRAGQEELNLMAILAGVCALQKKFMDAEAALAKVLAKPAALKELNPNVLPFALRSLGTGYRNEGRFAEAEPHFVRLVPLVLVAPGEGTLQTRIDMFLLAEKYSSQRKYADAEKAFSHLLEVQRRASGPEVINTVVTIANVGWARLQQKQFAEAEQTFREAAAILVRTAPATWERFNVDSMLGAALSAQKNFDEAEPLLIAGYNGMGTARFGANPTMVSRLTRDQAGEAIVELYTDWGKPDKESEWAEKLKADKSAGTTPK